MSRAAVFIPAYNYGRFLRECVESVLIQTVDFRVLIIDDASTDNTEDVAKELAARDARLEFRRHPVNLGAISTYNEGLEWAAGDYHLELDADDVLIPGALARAVHCLDAEPGVGLVLGREIRFEKSDSKPSPRTTAVDAPWRIVTGHEFLEASCSTARNYVPTPTAVVRTALLSQVGHYRHDTLLTAD